MFRIDAVVLAKVTVWLPHLLAVEPVVTYVFESAFHTNCEFGSTYRGPPQFKRKGANPCCAATMDVDETASKSSGIHIIILSATSCKQIRQDDDFTPR